MSDDDPRGSNTPSATGLPEDKPMFPTALDPVRSRDKWLGVSMGLGLALLVIALAYYFLGSPPPPGD